MHTPLDAVCCCKPAQPTHRLEQVSRRGLQRVPGETSQDPLSVDLVPNSGERESPDGLGVRKAAALEPGASAPLCLVPEVPLRSPARRKCVCGGS